jgi:ABC-type dipeptide/oligopeptide/nickel transport system permease subunit
MNDGPIDPNLGPAAWTDEPEEPGDSGVVAVENRSQVLMAIRAFLRHRLAMASLAILLIIAAAAVFAEQITPYGFDEVNLLNRGVGPQLEDQHYFGTDRIGRDYFSRVVYGTRTSLTVAIIVSLLSTVIGTIIGALAGYYRGILDTTLMRFTDFVIAVPGLAILLIAAEFVSGGSPYRVAVIISLLLWTNIARIVRGNYLALREMEFVEAARASGASDARIIFRHMLPNTLGPIIVNATLVVALAILIEATLSFLGFGVQPPTPALGKLINDGKNAMLTDWWLVTTPGLTIVAICLCVNFIGDGLRDALDPTAMRK